MGFRKHSVFHFLTLAFVFFSTAGFGPKPTIDREKLGVIFVGDTGTGKSEQFTVAKAMKKFCASDLCEWVLLLGDNFYSDGVKSVDDPQWKTKFEDPYLSMQVTFRPVLGNHDYGGNIQAQIDYSKKMRHWWMPSRYYKWIHKDAEFFAIDTEEFDGEQQKWLAKAIKNSTAKWKIVYGHHPIFSHGEHGDTDNLISDLLPIIDKKVDFYLCGHDHDMQFIERDGNRFIVSGSGAKLRKVEQGKHSLFAKSTLGFSHLTIEGDTAVVRMIDKDGKVLFSREVTKD